MSDQTVRRADEGRIHSHSHTEIKDTSPKSAKASHKVYARGTSKTIIYSALIPLKTVSYSSFVLNICSFVKHYDYILFKAFFHFTEHRGVYDCQRKGEF